MGEAKRRGTFEERKARAIKRDEILRERRREEMLIAYAERKPPTKHRQQQMNYLSQILAMAMVPVVCECSDNNIIKRIANRCGSNGR